jgi:hypothetical protein
MLGECLGSHAISSCSADTAGWTTATAKELLEEVAEARAIEMEFRFHRGLLAGISSGALLEIVKIGGETQVSVLLCSQLLLEHGRVGRRSIGK